MELEKSHKYASQYDALKKRHPLLMDIEGAIDWAASRPLELPAVAGDPNLRLILTDPVPPSSKASPNGLVTPPSGEANQSK